MSETDLPDDFYLGPAGFLPPDAVGARVRSVPVSHHPARALHTVVVLGHGLNAVRVNYNGHAALWTRDTVRLDLTPAPDGQPVRSVAPMLHAIAAALGMAEDATPPSLSQRRPTVWELRHPRLRSWQFNECDFDDGQSIGVPALATIPAELSPDHRLRRALVLIAQALEQR